jgi:hypothetical protein
MSVEEELGRELAIAIREHLEKQLAPLRAEIVAIKAANAELRGQVKSLQQGGLRYLGVYEDGGQYMEGDCVTSGGSLWRAQASTAFKPGQSTDWKLVVRKGRDARSNGHA